MPANHSTYQAPPEAWLWHTATESPLRESHRFRYGAEPPQGEAMSCGDKEPMFEKPLTPSDVGKLNRLVIPKQHAEKYFPLDGEAGEKGLLLSFEDEAGQPWRFRYSYWTSSQSYVLTKGWSRFVKEKQLDAGDVVLFLRRRPNGDRLYIGCRRQGCSRGSAPAETAASSPPQTGALLPWSPPFYINASSSPSSSCCFLSPVPEGEESSPAVTAAARSNSKQLRLFGVNLDCGHLLPGSQFMAGNADGDRL